jgi:hypothetical protein
MASNQTNIESLKMQKKKCEKIEKLEVVVEAVFCNCCGESIYELGKENHPDVDWINIEHSWGYFSKKDMTTHFADICEKCWDDFCKSFKIPVGIIDYDLSE